MRNADVNWSTFSTADYLHHNYARLRADDAVIVRSLAAFYAQRPAGQRIVEVGTGPNLYPVLAALPKAASIDVIEYATTNVKWLKGELGAISPSWQPFIDELARTHSDYKGYDFQRGLDTRVSLSQGSIFDLPQDSYDVASMHFVAESITNDVNEFTTAMHRFLGSLRPGGAFTAALMEGSQGYRVHGMSFPAVAIDEHAVREVLSDATEVTVQRIGMEADETLRAGYTGMLIVQGRRG